MKIIRQTNNGIEFLTGILRKKATVITKAIFWKIKHKSGKEEISLKLGRYKRVPLLQNELECSDPKCELTLDSEEFENLCQFISENHQPLIDGAKIYIPLDKAANPETIKYIKQIFNNPDKGSVLKFIIDNNVLPEELVKGIEYQSRVKAVAQFEKMLKSNLQEIDWQRWFKYNSWILGTEYVKILDEREVDTRNITDYLMEAYDGFLDIVEIKRPDGGLNFWANTKDHNNYIPHNDLVRAITQATKYIYEVEREANSVKFLERVNVKAIKPRCVLIFGRSFDWDDEKKEAYRILNSNYHNISIMTYDQVLERAKRMLAIADPDDNKESEATPKPAPAKAINAPF